MGIKGLWKQLLSDAQTASSSELSLEETVPRGSLLKVDGMAFLFHLLDKQLPLLYSSFMPALLKREYGGSYQTLRQLIQKELHRLQNDCGFKLKFFFDGEASYFKGDTTEKRRLQIAQQWGLLFDVVNDGRIGVKAEELPFPPLAKQELISVLNRLRIPFVITEYEADQEIAKEFVQPGKKKKLPSYVYSTDSDFLLMKNCKMIAMGAIDKYFPVKGKAEILETLSIEIWTREKISGLYRISIEQLIDLCIFQGNDFTSQFPKASYGLQISGNPRFTELLGMVQDGLTLFAEDLVENEHLKTAIYYSRSLYELEDVSIYYQDKYLSTNQMELNNDIEDGIFLKKQQIGFISDWVAEHRQEFVQSSFEEIFQGFCNHLVTLNLAPPWSLIKHCHVEAMFNASKSLHLANSSDKKIKVTWENVRAGNLMQLCAKHLINEVKRILGKTINWTPSEYFDGKVFHFLLTSSRKELPLFKHEQVPTALPDPVVKNESIKAVAAASLKNNKTENAQIVASKTKQSEIISSSGKKGKSITNKEESVELQDEITSSSFKGIKTNSASEITSAEVVQESPYEHPKVTTKPNNAAHLQKNTSGHIASTPVVVQHIPDDGSLPVDAHREEVLANVRRDRITIIHGETGCGKSSKIPLFILDEAERTGRPCKIIISQPRRIAVLNLRNRLREKLGDKVGMRMGHGVREESPQTKIVFVTTGYLVRLLAHHPNAMESFTHLIVDEVHERSVDSDLLCWLTRRYLSSNSSLKLLLMSATLHTALYQKYFKDINYNSNHSRTATSSLPKCISVGLRRFPIDIHYLENLASHPAMFKHRTSVDKLTMEFVKLVEKLNNSNRSANDIALAMNKSEIPANLVKCQFDIATNLVRSQCALGTSVLIFVSGIADIVELQTRFDGMTKYRCVAIHSDIPFEDQQVALVPAEPNEVKVVIATNAAESSITLPDCDVVICLGAHKAINYMPGDLLRSTLRNTWISKSSATQRAGRTGRVRPGTTFRLYPQAWYDYFSEHQEAEIHRQPLHEIVLTLKGIFHLSTEFSGVKEILQDMIEPPDMSKLQECLDFLFDNHMLSAATDDSVLTQRGLFAGKISVELTLSKLIILGVNLGIGAEAVVVACALSQPKTPFRIAHPLVHPDPDEYNGIVSQTFAGNLLLDNNLYSDPLMMLHLFMIWQTLSNERERLELLQRCGLVNSRVGHFMSACRHLLEETNGLLGEEEVHKESLAAPRKDQSQSHVRRNRNLPTNAKLTFENMHLRFNSNVVNKLRLILLWTLHHNLIRAPIATSSSSMEEINSIKLGDWKVPTNIFLQSFPPRVREEALIMEGGTYIYELPHLMPTQNLVPTSLVRLFDGVRRDGTEHVAFIFCIEKYSDAFDEPPLPKGKGKGKKKQQPKAPKSKRVKEIEYHAYFGVSERVEKTFVSELKKTCHVTPRVIGHGGSLTDMLLIQASAVAERDVRNISSAIAKIGGVYAIGGSAIDTKLTFHRSKPSAELLRSLYVNSHQLSGEVLQDIRHRSAVPTKSHGFYDQICFSNTNIAPEGSQLTKYNGALVEESVDRALSSILKPLMPSLVDIVDAMRLFNAYSVGQRDRKVRIKFDARESNSKSVKAVVPGSIEWLKMKEDEQKRSDEQAGNKSALGYDIHLCPGKPLSMKWKILNEGGLQLSTSSSKMDSNWSGALMSCRSIVSTSYIIGPSPQASPEFRNDEIFGVAYQSLTIAANNVAVEGVTLFPADRSWMLRAMLCIGEKMVANAEQELNRAVPDRRDVPPSEKCGYANKMLRGLKDQSIKPSTLLIGLVDDLFRDYGSAPSGSFSNAIFSTGI